MGDFVARLVGSKSGQAKLQMPAFDRRVDFGFTIFEAFGGEVPDRLKLTLGSI
jgi:hypothetical protein